MMRALGRAAALAALVLATTAHVGSPDAWYDGPAGPYHVLVHVAAPPVVPGIAIVNVKVAGATRVTAFVNKFDGNGGAPPPDVAVAAPDDPGWYRARLWVMAAGSNGVTVSVEGAQGTGSVVVPITAVAGRRLTFSGPLAGLLLVIGVFLLSGLLTIVRAAVRESVLPPGDVPDARRARRARFAVLRAVGLVAAVMIAMALWWRSSDAEFASTLFTPLTLTARAASPPHAQLVLTIDDSVWMHRDDYGWLKARGRTQLTGLIEDHGKIMHAFLISTDGRSFAHVHPTTTDTVTFTAVMPPVPAGTYRVFADIVHATGFTETLVTSLNVASIASAGGLVHDADDSWLTAADPTATSFALGSGASLAHIGAQPVAGAEAGLRFALTRGAGDTARLEPYMGMAGHAVVARDDGSVFVHLHPLGTISLAAQSQLTHSDGGGLAHVMHAQPALSDTVYFPYAFPQPGAYTVWVQLKRRGRVETAAFRIAVRP